VQFSLLPHGGGLSLLIFSKIAKQKVTFFSIVNKDIKKIFILYLKGPFYVFFFIGLLHLYAHNSTFLLNIYLRVLLLSIS